MTKQSQKLPIEKERKKMAKKVVKEDNVKDKKIEFDLELDFDDI